MNRFFLIFLLFPTLLYAGPFKWKHQNKFRNGLRQGLWIIYTDSTRAIKQSKGRYKKGNEKGLWRYYYPSGCIRKKEVWRFKKIKTKNYYENGMIQSFGKAKLAFDGTNWHYYLYDDWVSYLEDGKTKRITSYYNGKVINERIIDK